MGKVKKRVGSVFAWLKSIKGWIALIAAIAAGLWSIWCTVQAYNAGQREVGALEERRKVWRESVNQKLEALPAMQSDIQEIKTALQQQNRRLASTPSQTITRPTLTLDPGGIR